MGKQIYTTSCDYINSEVRGSKVIFRDQLAQSQQIYIMLLCLRVLQKSLFSSSTRILLLLHVFLCLGVSARSSTRFALESLYFYVHIPSSVGHSHICEGYFLCVRTTQCVTDFLFLMRQKHDFALYLSASFCVFSTAKRLKRRGRHPHFSENTRSESHPHALFKMCAFRNHDPRQCRYKRERITKIEIIRFDRF